jgi:hypothetical protein
VLILNHLRKQLSPLDATLTKTGGGGLLGKLRRTEISSTANYKLRTNMEYFKRAKGRLRWRS